MMNRRISGALLLLGLLLAQGVVVAEAKPRYDDIYLSGGRICRKCSLKILPPDRPQEQPRLVQLTNRKGVSGVYPIGEVVDVERHSLMRRIIRKGAQGVGLSGPIILPHEFDEDTFRDQTCKYCIEFPYP